LGGQGGELGFPVVTGSPIQAGPRQFSAGVRLPGSSPPAVSSFASGCAPQEDFKFLRELGEPDQEGYHDTTAGKLNSPRHECEVADRFVSAFSGHQICSAAHPASSTDGCVMLKSD